jgi:hypothetical protein
MREEIPFIKIGSTVRFPKKLIETWLEGNTRCPRNTRAAKGVLVWSGLALLLYERE